MRFAIFPLHLSKVLRLPRKSDARSYKVLHLSRKIISANLKISCSKMQPLSGNQRSDEQVSCIAPAKRNASLQIFFKCPTPAIVFAHFWHGAESLALPRKTISEPSKVVRACGAFNILTWKCASRHNGVHFRHVNFQKRSDTEVLCTFWLANVLRAKAARTFSTSQLPKVVSETVGFFNFWLRNVLRTTTASTFRHLNFHKCSKNGVLYTFWLRNVLRATTASTFRHLNFQKCSENGVLYTFWLRNVLHATTACKLSSLIWPDGSALAALESLRPSGATNHWKKHSVSRVFYLFPHLHLLSSDSFSSLIFVLLLFSSLTLPTSAFPSVHFVGSLTSKIPSIVVPLIIPLNSLIISFSSHSIPLNRYTYNIIIISL